MIIDCPNKKVQKESVGNGKLEKLELTEPRWEDLGENIGQTNQVYLSTGGRNHELGGHICVGKI